MRLAQRSGDALDPRAGGGRRHAHRAMTAHAAGQDGKRCLETGMDTYLTKPVRKELLRMEIERATKQNKTAEKEIADLSKVAP